MSSNRSAIVTGYSSGLGEAFAAGLLERGWYVVGVSRETEPEGLPAKYADNLIAVHGSVEEQETAERAFAAATRDRTLGLVVNCAGEGVFGQPGEYNAADIHAAMAANLMGLILFSDFAVRHMRADGGDIVNVMSTAGKKLRPAEAIYVASKWGAKAYTRTLRDALKAEKSPIRVFEVYPCGMKTRFWEAATRPVTGGAEFPPPEPIAEQVLNEISERRVVYCQEFTFERG
jgi:NAD(P)-dependent dehydrogenase (short-subunit alcohol dehydrogenase family)